MYFNVRVFYPNASVSYCSLALLPLITLRISTKKRKNMVIELGTFNMEFRLTPLVFTSTGHMGRKAAGCILQTSS